MEYGLEKLNGIQTKFKKKTLAWPQSIVEVS